MEASQEKRDCYLQQIESIEKSKLVYVDESGLDHNCYQNRGWGKKGKKLLGNVSGKHQLRTNIIAAQCDNEILAPIIFNGPCDSLLFLKWLETQLLPLLKPGQTVVMAEKSKVKCNA